MIIAEAKKWVGYMEHATPDLLGVFQANPGKGYHTIFERIIQQKTGADLSGLPWCVTFVHAVFINALGADKARAIIGRPHAGSRVLMRRMKRKKLWRGREYVPQRNDLVFLGNGKVSHVGIVVEVTDEGILAIDGNTVDPTGFFAAEDGGAVDYRMRSRDDYRIIGYAAISKALE